MTGLRQFCCLDFFHIFNIYEAEYNLRPECLVIGLVVHAIDGALD